MITWKRGDTLTVRPYEGRVPGRLSYVGGDELIALEDGCNTDALGWRRFKTAGDGSDLAHREVYTGSVIGVRA